MDDINVFFDIKKEDKRRNSHLVVSSYVDDASTLPIYSSVIQNLSIRLLVLITKASKFNPAIDVVNSYINANIL